MVVADSNYRCLHAGIDNYGKVCDSTIFKRSILRTKIQTNMLELPSDRPLAGTEGAHVPYFLVGDEGFALNRNILRPFCGSNLSVKNNVYKHRLCRARSYVEYAFGILSNKWRILQRMLNDNPAFAGDIVKASVFLHNFVRDRDGCKSRTL